MVLTPLESSYLFWRPFYLNRDSHLEGNLFLIIDSQNLVGTGVGAGVGTGVRVGV